MSEEGKKVDINQLKINGFKGEVFDSMSYRSMYATDASIYREYPVAVVYPASEDDVRLLVAFVQQNQSSIIPRGAGTSLAGQCVGGGIVMDVSRHMNHILELDEDLGIVTVQPGVVRDDLNFALHETPWFFGPNTSTSNRATIGGMVGNNSSGTTSVAYGVTRDKVLSLDVMLTDGTIYTLHSPDAAQKDQKLQDNLPHAIQSFFDRFVEDVELHAHIDRKYPDASIHRRNTGYALDLLLRQYRRGTTDWTKVICGSEGTLGVITKVKLKLDRKPPLHAGVVVSHYDHLDKSLRQVPSILAQSGIYALELMDDRIISCAAQSEAQKDNLFFIKGQPKAVLMTEVRAESPDKLNERIQQVIDAAGAAGSSYHQNVVPAEDMHRVWALRAAGLGVLSNIPGDQKAVACIEDTAVRPQLLADYIAAFASIMQSHGQQAIYYAHAGAGELHLRPVLNLKTKEGKETFRQICSQSAELVARYNGSLSGEHGDGRVRAPFIASFYGSEIYQQFIELKKAFDPKNIFNPGKIVHAKDLLSDLRFTEKQEVRSGVYDYAPDASLFHHTERCNGSGDCRKSHDLSPGMCPTYQASGEEIHTTRARANLMREYLQVNREDSVSFEDMNHSMSSCLGCKACKTECPSGVDVALLKSEYLYQNKKSGMGGLRDRLLAHPERVYRMNKIFPLGGKLINIDGMGWVKSVLGLAPQRRLPLPARQSLTKVLKRRKKSANTSPAKLILAVDEFINYYDVAVGLACVELLEHFGIPYRVVAYNSGRALISKGFLDEAEILAQQNIDQFHAYVQSGHTIIGIEPSALLSFRDEYGKFKSTHDGAKLAELNQHLFLFEEYLLRELESNRNPWHGLQFAENVHILQHVHCHQRALSAVDVVPKLFNALPGWMCTQIQTGCCGMAGGYGYEKENYTMSQAVAEMGLFPTIRAHAEHFIVASGMSCRHQIRDGLQRKAHHPAQLLLKMLKTKVDE